MWNWLRTRFRRNIVPNAELQRDTSAVPSQYRPRPFSELYVELDAHEDCDAEACRKLLHKIESLGAKITDDLSSIAVTLEDFFEGNRTKHSIAANVIPPAPYDTALGWYEHLKGIRRMTGVADVLVSIYMIEPHSDGRIGSWPYADTVWIYSSLPESDIKQLVAPLDPDEVQVGCVNDAEFYLRPPCPPAPGSKAYLVWWD